MKKMYLFLVGSLMALTVSAQEVSTFPVQPGYRLDSTYTAQAGVLETKSILEYDAQGRQSQTFIYTFEGAKAKLSGKSVAIYDDAGRAVKGESYDYQNGEYVLTGYTESSEFDSEGRPAVIVAYDTDDANPAAGIQPSTKTVVSKYNGLNYEDCVLYAWDGSNWQKSMTYHYDFNAQGLPVAAAVTVEIMGMSMTNTMTYEYDEHGGLKRTETTAYGVAITADYYNQYDANGNLTEQTCSTMGVDTTVHMYWSKAGSTAIQGPSAALAAPSAAYSLSGSRLPAGKARKGIYIQDGKKYFAR